MLLSAEEYCYVGKKVHVTSKIPFAAAAGWPVAERKQTKRAKNGALHPHRLLQKS